MEAEQGFSEDPKEEARNLLRQGVDPAEVAEKTGLDMPVINGLKGVLAKRNKRSVKDAGKTEGESSDNLGKAADGEEEINADLKKEAQITNSAFALARSQKRLQDLSPGLYRTLHGDGSQSDLNSPSRTIADLELAKYIKLMREQESVHHENNGSDRAVSELRRELESMREEMHKKDMDALKEHTDKLESQMSELRQDLRHSVNSNSDLAVIFKESKDLLSEVILHDGPVRRYLTPNETYIRKASDAPSLAPTTEPGGRSTITEQLSRHGLVSRVIERR